MTQLTDKIWARDLPNDATDIVIHNDPPKIVFSSKIQDPAQCGGDMICLPPGTYCFLFTTKTATEEQAASVVQIMSNGKISGRPQYRRYDRDNDLPARMWTRDSRHSLETLLRSKGIDPNKNYALIEKLK